MSSEPASERRVRLLRDRDGQALRIPPGFELPGQDAILRKEGDRLILEAAPRRSLLDVLADLEPIDDDLPDVEDRPAARF